MSLVPKSAAHTVRNIVDRQPHDFEIMFETLSDPEFFPDLTAPEQATLKKLVTRWSEYVKQGRFELSVPKELKMGEGRGDPKVELAQCEFDDFHIVYLPVPRCAVLTRVVPFSCHVIYQKKTLL